MSKVILIEFEDTELYKYHLTSLYSFVKDFNYIDFKYNLYVINSKLVKEVEDHRIFNFTKIKSIQEKFSNSIWTVPWIEFINYEFIAVKWAKEKEISGDMKCFFQKSFYLFIEDKTFKKNFFRIIETKTEDNINLYRQLLETHFFYTNEKFDIPITFCFLMYGDKELAFRLEIHNIDAIFEDFSIESLKREKNFMYFYKVLKGVEDHLGEFMKIDSNKFIKETVINNLKIHASFCI